MNSVIDKVLYSIFPRRCELCGEVVDIRERFCSNCQNAPRIMGEICKNCGLEKERCKCKDNADKPDYDGIIAPFYYENSLEIAVHKFKFGDYQELVERFSKEMSRTVQIRYNGVKFDAVTYVPMTSKREKKRGFNQSRLLAEAVSNRLGIPLEHSLEKIYEAPSQRGLSARQRNENLFGAFDVKQGIDVSGKTYLLVDDVKTTGSTLNECAATLKTMDADKVYALTLAIR